MIKKFLDTKTHNITLASFILGFNYLVSALLGLLRDRLLASKFGAGDELDIYYAAFRIPDFVAMIFIIGSISATIIPIFSEYLVRSKKEAWEFFSNLLNVCLVCLIVICFILIIFTPQILSFIVPGFSQEKKELTIYLTRIMFLSPIILGISNLISGILFVFKRYLVTSLSPIMYNLGIIFGIIFLTPAFGVKGLAFGVVLGAIFHLLIQIPILFEVGFKPAKKFNFFHPGFIKTIKLSIPRTFGLLASQINLLIITSISSTLFAGSIAIFTLSNNIQSLPISLIAASFSSAIFPVLTIHFSQKNKKEFIEQFSLIFREIIFLIIPLSFLIFLLRAQIVRVILGAGKFSWVDTRLTAACLGIFSFSIFAYGLSLFISKVFYAIQNTKIPSLITLFTVLLNIILSFLFVWLLSFDNPFKEFIINFLKLEGISNISVIGLSLAWSLSGIFQIIVQLIFLYKKIGDFKIKEILKSFKNTLISSIIMSFIVYFSLRFFSKIVDMKTFIGVFSQAFFASIIGILVYILISFVLKSEEIKIFKDLFLKAFLKINGKY
ncbi:MAG TPA: murein biosynthesis integral membrane protein MurJ [Candidatus Pacearchaeota archaeon]|nr:murein biosynthesis integral membrane protein MurJ [Candidatus Pacearchaeota archaeon]